MARRWLRFLCMAVALMLALPAVVDAQNQQTRDRRLREHEQRIREIIEQRREQQEEEERRRREREEAEPPREEREERPRFVSNVVMGLKFINEDGETAYSSFTRQGDTFISEVYLFNEDRNPVDQVRLALDFDKRFIEPVRIFDSALRPFMDEEPEFKVLDRDAIITYNARLERPIQQREVVLLRILWRARRPTAHTAIRFAFDTEEREDHPHTAIYSRQQNILGTRGDVADGVLSGSIMIEQIDRGERIFQGKAEELRQMYLGSIGATAEVGLELTGPEEPPRVGEEFVVRVGLHNPEGAIIDTINFAVLYDPQVLQVVDKDRFNWITSGVNVHDGPYHRDFPWDVLMTNEVRNDRGLALYRKGLSSGRALPSANFADIHFRAIAPTSRTSLGFSRGRPGMPNMTSVRYFGFEMLNLEDLDLSTPSIAFPVRPPTREEIARLRAERDEARRRAEEPEEDRGIRSLTIDREDWDAPPPDEG